jgi:sulfatase maturation enzyme AslB (radical SAM superfamily)
MVQPKTKYMDKRKIIPSQVQVETVAGYCNIKCIMCPIDKSIRKEIMSNDIFERIVISLLPIRNDIKIFTLLGLGETLLDKDVANKIKIAKRYQFKEVGLFTNGMLLNKTMTDNLLHAGLDVLICSIDGYTDKTQKTIRKESDLKKIIKNIDYFIKQRKETKIIIRFTRQELNKQEWPEFFDFWSKKLRKNDLVLCYDVHNAGRNIEIDQSKLKKKVKCSEVYKRLIIFSDGSIGLCCGDQFGYYDIGNILNNNPVELYNHHVFQHYREEMDKGNIAKLDLCRDCMVAYSINNSEQIKL